MDIKVINPIPQEDINFLVNLFESGLLPYELEKIGEGAQAEVYRYKNYAIKDYSNCGIDGTILEKLQDNDLFLKLYFYNEDFMVTEYLEITNAYEYYDRNVNINFTAFDIFKYCHKKNLIPYDIHDENVVITKDDKFKIIDVGSFKKNYNSSLDDILKEVCHDYSELDNIIEHVKRPPIAI